MEAKYIITVKRPIRQGGRVAVSRVAVSTLKEARDEARKYGLVAVPEWGCIDKLPDGTVVGVIPSEY